MSLIFAAVIAVALYFIGITVIHWMDTNDRINRDIEALVLSKQLTDDLNREAERWNR